ncbi:MAG: Sec-independent protein translocase subunit TatA/TatB [Solirubrobacterales bacterium]
MPNTIGFLPNIGPLEIAIVLVIVIIILGPKRIPAAFKSLTDGFRNLRDSVSGEEEAPKLTENREADPTDAEASEKSKTES